MNCREFTNEFEERNALTHKATLHLNDCPDCQKMSSRQTYVWQMIDALEQVNAPNDFDFRVKARIANARPTDFQPRFLPALRYVLSAGIIVLLVGFVAFNSSYFSNNQTAEQAKIIPPTAIAENNFSPRPSEESQDVAKTTQPFNDEKPSISNLPANTEPPKFRKEKEYTTVKLPLNQPSQIPKTRVKEDLSGSRVSTFKSATVITPENLSPNQKIERMPNSENSILISIEQIEQFLGIETILENGNRKVKSVRENSSAARSGVKVGDVIEELNGKKLSDASLRTKTIEAKTLTVMRGAEKIEISLQK